MRARNEIATTAEGPAVAVPGTILAIDPGLDAMGAAIFSLEGYHGVGSAEALARQLRAVRTIRTAAGDPMPDRIMRLAAGVHDLLDAFGPDRVYLEKPAIDGTYRRNRGNVGRDGMARAMAGFHLAMGAILLAATQRGATVELVHAPRILKDHRHLLSEAVIRHAAAHLETAARSSKDARDAVWLGCQQLAGPLAFDLRRARMAATQAPRSPYQPTLASRPLAASS